MPQSSAGANPQAPEPWPQLDWAGWKDTAQTLRLMTQIVGKVRLRHAPYLNHCWTATLYVEARGLTTGLMFQRDRGFSIRFDFPAQEVVVETCEGARFALPLEARSIARFYAALFDGLDGLGLRTKIYATPNEIADPIPFAQDEVHGTYDGAAALKFWRALLSIDRVFQQFRGGFIGKASPPHFFWGSFDLAVTRFSGRRAPPHPGGAPHLPLAVMRDAYSHEVSSAGFWPGGGGVDYPAFYAYAYPAPAGFSEAAVAPPEAFFHKELGEFILPYEAVRKAASPDAALTRFLQSTYVAAADLGRWDRAALERGGDPSGGEPAPD